jgi:Tfp pilus assembly protein PilF
MAAGNEISNLQNVESLELAQALANQLSISPIDWHRRSSNRQVRAKEQVAAALVYLLNDNPEEALPRLEQAVGWLNRTIKAPPRPTHGERHG